MLLRPHILLWLILLSSTSVFGWGKKGHDVVCYIAECHLSESARRSVDEVLEGRSMVYYANWADGAKYTKEYSYSRPWHYMNIENDTSVARSKRSKSGDVLSACNDLVESLSSRRLGREEERVALKLLIHLIGDMHQPLHLGRAGDKSGGTIPVVYFVESASLHSAWDYHLVMGAHEWSYREWQEQIDRLSPEEVAEVVSGDFESWIDQMRPITTQIYRDTPAETRIYYDYVRKYSPIIEQQLLYAGLRLASILNKIYT